MHSVPTVVAGMAAESEAQAATTAPAAVRVALAARTAPESASVPADPLALVVALGLATA